VVQKLGKYMGCRCHSRYKAVVIRAARGRLGGTTTGLARVTLGSDNGDADDAGSATGSGR
jgi:hypothetical protein